MDFYIVKKIIKNFHKFGHLKVHTNNKHPAFPPFSLTTIFITLFCLPPIHVSICGIVVVFLMRFDGVNKREIISSNSTSIVDVCFVLLLTHTRCASSLFPV